MIVKKINEVLKISLFSFLVCLITFGCMPDYSKFAPPTMKVEAIVAQEEPIRDVYESLVELRAQESAYLKPEVDGVIQRILVKPGDKVSKGS
ncbi:MAG TPA: hypothetical protein V6C96_01375, partial [Vampirovibrionales bacterium]